MKVLLDLNVLLDVEQNRIPHYHDSAKVLSLARLGEIQAFLPVTHSRHSREVLTSPRVQIRRLRRHEWAKNSPLCSPSMACFHPLWGDKNCRVGNAVTG
jgi:hypothetical protein